MNIKYINGCRIKLTLSHRYANFTTDLFFDNYKQARQYVEDLHQVESVLNGYTIRRMRRLEDGSEYCEQVLMHRRFVPLNQCVTGKPVPREKSPEEIAVLAAIVQRMNDEAGNEYNHRGSRKPTMNRADRAFYGY